MLCRAFPIFYAAIYFCSFLLQVSSIHQHDGQDGQNSACDPPRRKLKSLGLLEGRNEETVVISAPRAAKPGEEEGAFSGRNRKKLKHRRVNMFEVTKKELEERNFMTPRGDLDVKGLKTLMEAEDTREGANPGGVMGLKHHTLEDLDRMYPTPEGNRRLGLEDDEDRLTLRNFSKSSRWDRNSHFVQFRKPGKLEQLLPDEVLNYAKDGGRITIFVQGSAGYRYAIECLEYDTLGHVKDLVWAEERHHRHVVEKLEVQDNAEKFDIKTQELTLNGMMLYPDSRTMKWFNITNYAILHLIPKPEGIELDENAKKFTIDLLWWREVHRCWADQSDSDEKVDEDYRALKEVYLEACEVSYQEFVSQIEGLDSIHEECLRRCPNLGLLPHPELVNEEKIQQLREELDAFCSEESLKQMREEVTREVEEVNKGAASIQPLAEQCCPTSGGQEGNSPPFVTMRATEEAVQELLDHLAERASWNTANGCPIPNLLPASDMRSPGSSQNFPKAHSCSDPEKTAGPRPSSSPSDMWKAESDSLPKKSKNLQQSKSYTDDEDIGPVNDRSGDCKDDDHHDSSENSHMDKSCETDEASKERTMAAAEASYSTFDIPKELLREVAQADAELRAQKKTLHEESLSSYQTLSGKMGDLKDGEDEQEEEIRPIVFN